MKAETIDIFLYLISFAGILVAGHFLLTAFIRIYTGIRNYNALGKETFMKKLKDGFENITAAQKTRAELNGMSIVLIGIVIGLIATPLIKLEGIWWWAEIILAGSLIISLTQYFGKWQLYKIQKKQDELIASLNSQAVSNSNVDKVFSLQTEITSFHQPDAQLKDKTLGV